MGMFSRLFGPQMKYDDPVEKLVPSAHILAALLSKTAYDVGASTGVGCW